MQPGCGARCWAPEAGADLMTVGDLHYTGFLPDAGVERTCSIGLQCVLDIPGHRLASTAMAKVTERAIARAGTLSGSRH